MNHENDLTRSLVNGSDVSRDFNFEIM